MASETFSYTNSSGSIKTLTFDTSGRLLSAYQKSIVPNQISNITLGGIRLTQDFGNPKTQYKYTAIVPNSSVIETDIADIEEFISSDYINFAENAFTWTENDGATTHTVYMVNDYNMKMIGGSYCVVEFLLEEQNT